jgi:hypothetical protein
MKIIIANTNIQALLKATDKILGEYGRHDIPEKFKGQATLSALKSMFQSRTFSVCDVRIMAKLNDVVLDRETEDYFSTLHCVSFADMTQETRDFLFAKCVDLFRGNIVMANVQNEVAR